MYLSVRFNRYRFNQVGVSIKGTAATNLLRLCGRLLLRKTYVERTKQNKEDEMAGETLKS